MFYIFLKDLSNDINIFSLNIFYFILYEINLRLYMVKFYGWVSYNVFIIPIIVTS